MSGVLLELIERIQYAYNQSITQQISQKISQKIHNCKDEIELEFRYDVDNRKNSISTIYS